MPTTGATGRRPFRSTLDKLAATTRPLEARITVSMAESGGRAVERKLTLPVTPDATDDRRQAGVFRPLAGRRRQCRFRRGDAGARRQQAGAQGSALRAAQGETSYQWYRQNGQWQYEPIKRTERVADGTIDIAADKPARLSLPVKWGRYRLEVARRRCPVTSLALTPASMPNPAPTRPTCWKSRSTRTTTSRRHDERRGDRAHRRPSHAQCLHRSAGGDASAGRQSRRREESMRGRQGLGHRRLSGRHLAPPARPPAQRMPGRAIGVQWFAIDRAARTLPLAMNLPRRCGRIPRSIAVEAGGSRVGRRGARRRCRRRCRHSQSHQLQAAGAGRLLSRPAPADRRDPRSLRATDRRHAGRARADPHRRRHAGAELSGSPPTQAPLALYSGIVKVGADGSATVSFDIPAFAGTVRVMAVAWSKDKVGKASDDVIVRDPVVLTATLAALPAHRRQAARCSSMSTMSRAPPATTRSRWRADGAAKIDGDKAADVKLAASSAAASRCR